MSENIPARFSANFYITNDEGLVGKANYGFGGLTPPTAEAAAAAPAQVPQKAPEGLRLMDAGEVPRELLRERAMTRGPRGPD